MSKKSRRVAKARRALFTLSLVLVMMLVAVGGTIAWLTDSSDTLTNTFNTSTIGVTLEETKGTKTDDNQYEFQMVPGHTIDKDPKATVTAGSEDAWLFVQLTKGNDFDKYMTYEIATGWETVDAANNVYGRKVTGDAIGTAFSILKDDKVTVKDGVTKEDMTTAKDNEPTLTITAYVCQLYKTNGEEFTAAKAWEIAPTNGSVTNAPATGE